VIDPDLEWEFIDGSIVKAHQHSSGAAYEQESAIGKSVAGNTTKIHMAVDSCGLPSISCSFLTKNKQNMRASH
jgi:hypothetical protein